MSDRRLQDLIRFYSILNRLEKTIGGARALADWHSLVRKDILSHCYRPLNVPRSEALVRCPRLASRFKVRIVPHSPRWPAQSLYETSYDHCCMVWLRWSV